MDNRISWIAGDAMNNVEITVMQTTKVIHRYFAGATPDRLV